MNVLKAHLRIMIEALFAARGRLRYRQVQPPMPVAPDTHIQASMNVWAVISSAAACCRATQTESSLERRIFEG